MQNSRLKWIEGEVGKRGRGLSLMAHNGGLQMIREVTGEKCAEKHTCKKREIVEIYLRNFFWIFRKILG